jgi:type III pantothenate kinase
MLTVLIDIGNSSAKLGMADSGFDTVARCDREPSAIVNSVHTLCLEHGAKSISSGDLRIVVASVADETFDTALAALVAERLGCELHFCQTPSAGFGVMNSYDEPHRMGVDRWLALIAAWSSCPEALLVFDAGTALTCDVVAASGQHMGGYIIPGSQLMEMALRRDTKRIRYDDSQPVTLDAGNTTATCVSSGIWMALVGAISALQQRYPDHHSILTGGDGQALIDIGIVAEWRPHLVLEGLQLTAGEIETTT